LDDLVQVQQQGGTTGTSQWRTRTFTYDGLARLICSSNPENSSAPCPATAGGGYTSATVGYTYDADGDIVTKVDARGITICYGTWNGSSCNGSAGYDPDDRLLEKSYSNGGSTVIYVYSGNNPPSGCTAPSLTVTNGVDRRTAMCDAAGSEAFSYDPMGRTATDLRTLNNPPNNTPASVSMRTIYTYNLDGTIASMTYPSGHTVTYQPTNIGQPQSATDTADSVNYAESAVYNPAGALSSLLIGQGGSFSGINLNSTYNNRLQPASILAYSSGSGELNLGYCYYPISAGRCPAGPQGGNNGNVTYIMNGATSSRSEVFTYDALNRIASVASGTWGEAYSLDAWGNLQQFVPYNGLTLPDKSAAQTANGQNQIIGFCYDAAGNLLAQSSPPCPSPEYSYNAENQLTFTASTNYLYDGDGNRVEKYMLNNQGVLTYQQMYWYGGGGNTLEETDQSGSTSDGAFHEYVFLGDARIARRDGTASGDVEYYLADHLGSARVVTDSNGNTLSDIDYCPYGAECYVASDSSGNNYKFTGKERDAESGLDNSEARYDASSMGRFMSADPSGIGLADLTDPQQLNLYTYVRNNPIILADPDGLVCVHISEATRTAQIGGEATPTSCLNDGGYWVDGPVNRVSQNSNGTFNFSYSANGTTTFYTSYLSPNNPTDQDRFNAVVQAMQMANTPIVAAQKAYAAIVNARNSLLQWEDRHQTLLQVITVIAAYEGGDDAPEEGLGPGNAPKPPADPAQPPGPGWEWRGSGPPGSPQGNWWNPSTGESLHPNLEHGDPIGPHWDYKDPDGTWWRVDANGVKSPK
jgi:RHS repeat-associated protein